jgi:hypothetical protein
MTVALPSLVAPTRLRVPDLLQATDVAADHVLSGRYDHVLPAGGLDTDERWFTRLDGDDELDVWLISWVPERSTELHDHGGSLGALTVVSGALVETRWDGAALRQRRLEAGDQAGFPLGWVHDVVWAPSVPAVITGLVEPTPCEATPFEATPLEPTLSVHAYSPPLTAMSYYEVTAPATLRRQRTELTDKAEGI